MYDPAYDLKYDAWKLSTPPNRQYIDCPHCNGTGEVNCPYCGGSGVIDGELCVECVKGKTMCEDCEGTGIIVI